MLPRILAIVLMIASVVMIAPIGTAALRILQGEEVPSSAWIVPLTILATATTLMWLLARRQFSMQLYVVAFALWLVTATYFFVRFLRAEV